MCGNIGTRVHARSTEGATVVLYSAAGKRVCGVNLGYTCGTIAGFGDSCVFRCYFFVYFLFVCVCCVWCRMSMNGSGYLHVARFVIAVRPTRCRDDVVLVSCTE